MEPLILSRRSMVNFCAAWIESNISMILTSDGVKVSGIGASPAISAPPPSIQPLQQPTCRYIDQPLIHDASDRNTMSVK
jgi:hypothetical protein